MIIALIVLGAIVVVQAMLNWALLNRLLVAKGIAPIQLPEVERKEDELPAPKQPRKLFSLKVGD